MGVFFFIPAFILFLLSAKNESFSFPTGLMLAGALGAEIKFILVQKYQIGIWCPICLSIAACIFVASLCYAIKYGLELKKNFENGSRGDLMKSIWKGIAGVSIAVLGFFVAVLGISKVNPLAAAENTIKESVAFGNTTSPIEVYVFTDWACPACRQLEPEIEKMAPDVMEKARLIFVDHAIHTETLNYSPYNVSFMIKNKENYLKLRDALTKLSEKVGAPTDPQIEELAKEFGVNYEQLNFSDITLSQKYFKQLGKQFNISKTPTIVILNRETKKGKKLIGAAEISQENVDKAIETLKK
jgi:protein-disulfide isomerase